jgi:hypothetical protein
MRNSDSTEAAAAISSWKLPVNIQSSISNDVKWQTEYEGRGQQNINAR